MNTNRLIFIIAISFSLLVNIPRIVFLFGSDGEFLDNLMEVSLEDTFFRILMLFGFCYVILKFNIKWLPKSGVKYPVLVSIFFQLLVLSVWIQAFKLVNKFVYNFDAYLIYPRINDFVYFFVLLMLLVISRAIKLQNQSKYDAIEKEQLKQQSLQNELAALKNQVNPHFLFNTLNSLSLLVREDQKAAGKFINKLSFLYRYILQSKDQDLVTVSEELQFLESYVHLIKQRYRDNFNVNINISKEIFQKRIPTLALQLLMENTVKHNQISNEKPLYVSVFDENGYVIVKNKLQERTMPVESTNIGLGNLNSRFKLQMNKEIIVLKDDENFIVKIPFV